MKSFPAKAPGEELDYSQGLADLIPDGIDLDEVDVVVDSCDPPEDPVTLEVSDIALAESDTPGQTDTVVFWLTGGTMGTTYILKTTVSDSQSPRDRTFVRYSKISIKQVS